MATEPAGQFTRYPRPPEPGAGSRPGNTVYPDRLIRVLAEGLLSIEQRRVREQHPFAVRLADAGQS